MAHRVLIVGCGELGSRHLQAVASLAAVSEVEVVDSRPEALEIGRSRFLAVPDRNESIEARWLTSLKDISGGGSLCVVATQAAGRCALVEEIAETAGYASFLLEKMVAQSVLDYRSLLEFSKGRGLSVWVNCKTRAHESHKRVKQHLDPNSSITLSVIGGNHGLANNGIHMADLFVFYDDADHIESMGGHVDAQLHASKRPGILDLSGTLAGHSEKGSLFMLSFSKDHEVPACFSVVSPRYRAIVDDMAQTFYESTPDNGWEWRQIDVHKNMLVSQMTKKFASDILSSGSCELPTLEQCFPAHEFILSELQPHFNRLLKREADCPIT